MNNFGGAKFARVSPKNPRTYKRRPMLPPLRSVEESRRVARFCELNRIKRTVGLTCGQAEERELLKQTLNKTA